MDKDMKLIIACEALRGELEHFKDSISAEILWVEHSLHNFPDQLKIKIQEKILEAEAYLEPGATILLFFGNCGGALNGIKSKTLNLIYPDVDDCIPIIIGSAEKFRKLHKERPGTFYLNKAWIESGQDPLGSSKTYMEIYGPEKGWKVSKRMYKSYSHFTLIDNGCYQLDPYRKHVQEACQKFDKEYAEVEGDLKFVSAILNNQCRMIRIPPKLKEEN